MGHTCREPLQEDYGWGFYVDADGCSIWISVSFAAPDEEEPVGMPEWHVGADHDSAPWMLRQWFRRRRGRQLEQEIFATLREAVVTHPEIIVVREE
jgi:hypothetical protein